jgi:hypothetical protein
MRQDGRRVSVRIFIAVAAVLTTAVAAPSAGATTGYSVRSDGDDFLYRIDLETATETAVGTGVGFGDVEGLAFNGAGTLYGFDDSTNQLITIDTGTGVGTAVGPSGITPTDLGLDFDCGGTPYLSVDAPSPFNLHRLDPATGAATVIGPMNLAVTALGFDGTTLFGLTGDNDNRLVTVDRSTGTPTPVGPTGINLSDGGLAVGPDGKLWGINDNATGDVFTVDKPTGAATVVAPTEQIGFEGLAIDAPSLCKPPTVAVSSGPSGPTNDPTPTFGFTVQPAGLSVQCAVGGVSGACSGPGETHTTSSLADGVHTFTVTGTARDGVSGSAQQSFTVDTKPPNSKFKKRPANNIDEDVATFKFKANEPVSKFKCKLDSGKYKRCKKKKKVKNLDEGKHKFLVRATDLAGNVEKKPAKDKFVVTE